jgi:outer membrane protein TolC
MNNPCDRSVPHHRNVAQNRRMRTENGMLRKLGLLAVACCTGCVGWGNLVGSPNPMTIQTENGTPQQVSAASVSAGAPEQAVENLRPDHQTVSYTTELVDPATPVSPTLRSPVEAAGDDEPMPLTESGADVVELNLPTVLSLVDRQHPAVAFARWRVQEAYARADQARVLWLPTIQYGFSFYRHDGNLQASEGAILDVNRNSFQYGLGAGAVGAGTTPNPGVVAQFHLADAIFEPKITQRRAWANGHAAAGVLNRQLRDAAVAYIQLLSACQDTRILEESRNRAGELTKLTTDFAKAGEGLQADADRMRTELTLLESRVVASREQVEVASARLVQAISLGPGSQIVPLDPTVVPIDLVTGNEDASQLISLALVNRPELKESQALVAAACEQFRRQKYAPFVPSVLLGYSTGGFGGGLGNDLENIDGRYDFDAVVLWQVRNIGFGEAAARREATAQLEQARFEQVRLLDQVASEVTQARAGVRNRFQQISITRRAIQSAEDSYQRNLSRIRDGQGLPIEVLQSVQALEDAQRAYLRAVVEYDKAQFQLQYALGWPISAPPKMP